MVYKRHLLFEYLVINIFLIFKDVIISCVACVWQDSAPLLFIPVMFEFPRGKRKIKAHK